MSGRNERLRKLCDEFNKEAIENGTHLKVKPWDIERKHEGSNLDRKPTPNEQRAIDRYYAERAELKSVKKE